MYDIQRDNHPTSGSVKPSLDLSSQKNEPVLEHGGLLGCRDAHARLCRGAKELGMISRLFAAGGGVKKLGELAKQKITSSKLLLKGRRGP